MAFRDQDFRTHLFAIEKELPSTMTFVNLQGELDKKYQVTFCLSARPKRAKSSSAWPSNLEENLDRLKDAGLPLERGIPLCTRCKGISLYVNYGYQG